MNQPALDFSRWNRAGLQQLLYVDGNAATYLEQLRELLRLQFADDDQVLAWLAADTNDKSHADWAQRLLAQYHAPRRDYAWEMLRTYARALHVLTRYIDAYGNERYIRTAQQWDNVRRLVNMLDYHPAPPASAETYVALIAKIDKHAIGLVDAGLAMKNQPSDGSSPLIFETLQDIEVDYRLNRFRAENYSRSQDTVQIPATNGIVNYLVEVPVESVSVGARGILSWPAASVAVEVVAVATTSVQLKIIATGFGATQCSLADIRLHLSPQWQAQPLLNGSNVVVVDQSNASVVAQDLLLLEAGSQIYRVLNVQGSRVQLSAAINNGSGLLRTTALASPQLIDSNLRFVLPKERQLSTVWKADGSVASVHSVPVPAVPSQTLYQYVNGGDSARVHYLPNNSAAVFHVVDNAAAALQFEGKPGELASDDWVLLQSESGAWFSHRVASIDEVTKGYLISTSTNSSSQRWLNAVGHFSQVLAFAGHDKNTRPVWSTSSATNSVLEVELEHDIGALRPGRTLWVVGPQQRQLVEVATVDYFDSAINIATITVKPSLQSLYMPRFATEIFGNVVLAGHGESRAEHILGNGNRIEKNQQFTYAKTGVSFVQSAQFSSGVSAGIQVAVDGRNWTQVDNLRNASATDAHYTVHLTEEFYLQINFGDGEHGQRLPTGVNNLRIVARFGNGAKGNLAALSLDKLKKPHALLDQVIQPAAATGGGDLEPIESLRESAPASVLTLQRAVSVSDYAALAQRLSSVWQARAFPLPDLPGASDRIQVVLVPVGGGDLGELATSVGAYLHGRGRPGVEVLINRYRAIAIALILHLRIDAQGFDPDLVVDAVGTALEDAFSLYRSRLGEPLFRAQVYAVVEAIAGVESVDVDINPGPFVDEDGSVIAPETLNVYRGSDGSVRRLSPAPDQLIYINSDVQAAQISWEAANV